MAMNPSPLFDPSRPPSTYTCTSVPIRCSAWNCRNGVHYQEINTQSNARNWWCYYHATPEVVNDANANDASMHWHPSKDRKWQPTIEPEVPPGGWHPAIKGVKPGELHPLGLKNNAEWATRMKGSTVASTIPAAHRHMYEERQRIIDQNNMRRAEEDQRFCDAQKAAARAAAAQQQASKEPVGASSSKYDGTMVPESEAGPPQHFQSMTMHMEEDDDFDQCDTL